MIEPYVLDLDPAKQIFPVANLIDQLMAMGIKGWMITPVFTSQLHNCVARHSEPRMESDGDVKYTDLPGGGDFMPSRFFKLTDARWAILSFDKGGVPLCHIYLWPGASEASEEILETARQAMKVKTAIST
jgi:hypothetical protein